MKINLILLLHQTREDSSLSLLEYCLSFHSIYAVSLQAEPIATSQVLAISRRESFNRQQSYSKIHLMLLLQPVVMLGLMVEPTLFSSSATLLHHKYQSILPMSITLQARI